MLPRIIAGDPYCDHFFATEKQTSWDFHGIGKKLYNSEVKFSKMIRVASWANSNCIYEAFSRVDHTCKITEAQFYPWM